MPIADDTTHNDAETIAKTADFVRARLQNEATGHDWWHTYRVWQIATRLAKQEKADLFVVQLAALLHDIADWKFHAGNMDNGPEAAKAWLAQLPVDQQVVEHVCRIVGQVSFKGAKVADNADTIEARVVQDADRLDALGAIGIARCFATGAKLGNPIHDPERRPVLHASFDEYKKSDTTSINHFHEKLLLLKKRMHTATAKKIAEQRQRYMQNFLRQFHAEWDGTDIQ